MAGIPLQEYDKGQSSTVLPQSMLVLSNKKTISRCSIPLPNDGTVFTWKLPCHWPKVLRQCQVAFKPWYLFTWWRQVPCQHQSLFFHISILDGDTKFWQELKMGNTPDLIDTGLIDQQNDHNKWGGSKHRNTRLCQSRYPNKKSIALFGLCTLFALLWFATDWGRSVSTPSLRRTSWALMQSYDRPRASIHNADGRLTTRSREASKPRDSGLDFSNRSEFWQALRQ